MAIIQQPDAVSMSGNMKKFIVSSGGQISFRLADGGAVLLDATYEPGVDGRATIDVRDIVESRLSYLISHHDFYEQPSIVKSFTATIDGVVLTFKVIRAGVANLADTPSNWLRGNFLTWQPTNKQVTYYSPEWLTYYAQEACNIMLKATFPDNTVQNINLGACGAGKAFTCNLQYAVIAGLLGQVYPSYYDVWVESASGTRLTYVQRYLYSETRSEQEQWFMFENSLGGFDTVRAYGDTDFMGNHQHKISTANDVSSEYQIDTNRTYNKNTGYLDEYERRWMLDFFPSRRKYVYHQSALRPIVVSESDVKYTASDLPSSYNFFYRFTADNEAALLNLVRNQEDIPASITIPDIDSPDFSLPPRLSEYPRVPLHEGVILPAFDPNSEDPTVTTLGAILSAAVFEVFQKIAAGEAGGELVNLLRSTSLEVASDYSVFSSYRTLLEIEKYINEYGLDNYLSKLHNDTAQGVITFLQGIIAAGTSTFVNMIATGKITASNIDVNNTLKADILRVITQAYLQDVILKGQLNSETFSSGFLGEGFRLKNVDENWVLELDKLVVRKTMEVYEIIVQRIRYQGGQVIHSPAGAKLTAVTDGGSYWKCEHDGTVDFITDAQVLCQNFNVGSRQQNPDGSQTLNNVSVKRYWRRVTSYGAGWFNLSKTDCEAGSGTPEVSDEVVVLGHRNNPDWQNAILIASTGGNTPYIAHYAGINSFSLAGKEVVREGNLEGIVDSEFGQLTGYGLYSNNAYLKGVFRLLSGKTVEEVIGEINGELISVKSYVQTEIEAIPGKITMEVSKVQIGGRNLLRNYDQRFGMDFWSEGAISVDESGSPVVPTLLITGYVYIDPIVVNRDGTPLMPSSITLNISDGTQRTVPATWSSVDTSTTGPKTSYATYDMPAGVTGAPVTVSVIVNVTIGLLLIVSYVEPQPVTVYAGETPTLPSTVIVNLNDGTTRIVTVTWAVDTSTWGEKSAIATYNMPAGVSGTKPQISATVNVLELTISNVAQPQPVYVQVSDTPTLPTTVTLTLNNGTTRVVDVTWSSFSTDVVAVYELIGSYNLPQYVTGAKPAVTLDLTVQEDAIPVTITSISQPEAITVPVGGVPVMPATITLNLSDLSTTQVAVTWGSYDTSTAGTFSIPGTYSLPEGVSGTMPAVAISLVVDAQMVAMWDGRSFISALPGVSTPSMTGWDQVSGRYTTGAIIAGALYMWGRNDTYQLGLGDNSHRNTPVQVGVDADWDMVSASTWHTIAIKNGELYAWGLNNKGQLGLGDLTTRQTPTKVGTFSDWTYISANELFSFGIRSGMLYAWGHNNEGQLGLYDTSDRISPTRVGSLTTWTRVAAGAHFGIGLAGGGLYTWGFNGYGQLGMGNTTTYRYPVKVGSYNDWTHIGAGAFHASAIRAGSLYSWGQAEYYVLGINTQTNVLSPTLVGSGYLDLAVRQYHTIATKSDGIYGWGDGRQNEFGNGNPGYVATPTKISSIQPGLISVGDRRSFYMSDGVLYGVGNNDYGALGVGDTDSRETFSMIGTLLLELNETNSGNDTLTGAIKDGWVNQKAYLYLNNKSAAAVSLVVDRDGTPTTYLLASGIDQYSIDLEGATGFGLSGTDYDVEVIEFAIGQYGIEPVWYEGI